MNEYSPAKRKIGNLFSKYPDLGALIAFLVLFTIFAIGDKDFYNLLNLGAITSRVAEMGIIVVGVTLLMISGEFDISVGSNYALSAVVFGLILNTGLPQFVAFLAAVAVGAFIGFTNGIITLKLGIPSFIATLGTMMFWRGFVLGSSGGSAYVRYTDETTLFLRVLNSPFFSQFRTSLFWLLIIILIFYYVLAKTKYGNYVYSVGGNPEAARSMGVNVNRVKLINFTLVGLLSGVAGAIAFARYKGIDPYMGQDMALQAIAASVIGGAALYGGYGSIAGSIIGTVIISMIGSALIMIGVGAFWFNSVVGMILIASVVIFSKVRRLETL